MLHGRSALLVGLLELLQHDVECILAEQLLLAMLVPQEVGQSHDDLVDEVVSCMLLLEAWLSPLQHAAEAFLHCNQLSLGTPACEVEEVGLAEGVDPLQARLS